MKIGQAFPSNYLKADDLNGQNVTVTISEVDMVEMGKGRDKETKLLISFRGKEKQLVCNKTNANTIAKMYGDETDGWIGQRITIGAREVEFQGEMMLGLRVSLQKPSSATEAPAPPVPVTPPPAAPPVSEEPPAEEDTVPF